jgi:hypothetical protein
MGVFVGLCGSILIDICSISFFVQNFAQMQ